MAASKPRATTAKTTPHKNAARYCLPVPDLAGMLDVAVPTLRTYFGKGCPRPPKTGGERSANAWFKKAQAWLVDYKRERAAKPKAVNQYDNHPEAGTYQRDWQKTRAERAQLELDERRGDLVHRKDVVEQAGKAVLAVRGRLNLLVQKMMARLVNVQAHVVHEELTDEVDAICESFARGMSRTFEEFIEPDAACPFCEIQERRRHRSTNDD